MVSTSWIVGRQFRSSGRSSRSPNRPAAVPPTHTGGWPA